MNPLRRLFFGPGTFAEPLRTALLAEDPVFYPSGWVRAGPGRRAASEGRRPVAV